MGQVCTFGYGKVNLSDTYASWTCQKITAPFVRVSAVTSGRRHGQDNRSNVGAHDLNGILIQARSEHEYGTVVLFQAGWKRRGAPIADGAMFFRLRLGAPLYRVYARLPVGRENRYGDRFEVFSGYADLLNSDDLRASGFEVPVQYERKFMVDEEVEECFILEQIAPETVARPAPVAVIGETGIQLRELPQLPGRRIRLRPQAR